MNIDDLVHRSDPARSRTDDADPGLLDRILTAGPARSSTGGRTALLAAGVTAAVILSVIGGITLARSDRPASSEPSPSGSSLPSPEPVDCLSLIRGWRPTYLPAGFTPNGPEQKRGSVYRGQSYARTSAQQPTTQTFITLGRQCTDPAAQPSGVPTREPGTATATAPPQLTVRGHPAMLYDHSGELVTIDWEEAPNLRLSLQTSTSTPGDQLVSVPELIRVAAGLTHESVSVDPSPPAASCPGLTSYRAATLPPGYRPGSTRPIDENGLVLTYVKGSGARRVTVTVVLGCEVVIAQDPAKDRDPVMINGKNGWITRPGHRPVQAIWKEGPVEFWIIVGAETPDEPQPTRNEVLTVASSLRPA